MTMYMNTSSFPREPALAQFGTVDKYSDQWSLKQLNGKQLQIIAKWQTATKL